ncbi:Trm112 family protein [Neomegalonema perideroedes]|uniref:Trm112 family protein n=1 Tax=Neomegalonema perideroedes TaxID=217219 RepID=UPI000379DE62|nr:Trm112 family protein [Neomegalonema perideroedes]
MSREETAASLHAVPASREISPKLLEALVCPLTKGPLEYRPEAQELVSRNASLAYPIRDGLPIMLPSEARKLDV